MGHRKTQPLLFDPRDSEQRAICQRPGPCVRELPGGFGCCSCFLAPVPFIWFHVQVFDGASWQTVYKFEKSAWDVSRAPYAHYESWERGTERMRYNAEELTVDISAYANSEVIRSCHPFLYPHPHPMNGVWLLTLPDNPRLITPHPDSSACASPSWTPTGSSRTALNCCIRTALKSNP